MNGVDRNLGEWEVEEMGVALVSASATLEYVLFISIGLSISIHLHMFSSIYSRL
jgi:hypothetical protein